MALNFDIVPVAVQKAYQELLGRDPDEQGLAYWTEQLRNGALTYEGLRSQLKRTSEGTQRATLSDPTFSAFLRNQGVRESEIQSEQAALVDRIARQRNLGSLGYDLQQEQAEKGTDTSWENRGLYASGGRLAELADRRRAIDVERAKFNTSLSDEQTGSDREAAQRIAELRRQRDEQELAARQRLTLGQTESMV